RKKKDLAALEKVRFEELTEGLSVQVLHIGSYDDEAPTIARMHGEFMPAHGLAPTGRHHEIYLSDARGTEPARLRTILRQPARRHADGPRTTGRGPDWPGHGHSGPVHDAQHSRPTA